MGELDSDTGSEISLDPKAKAKAKQWGVSLQNSSRVARKRKRIPFTTETDEWILDFVEKRSNFDRTVGGNRLWQLMESEDPSGHSWHSLRSRYTKFLVGRKQKKEEQRSSLAKLRALRPIRATRNRATGRTAAPPPKSPKSPEPVSDQHVPKKSRAVSQGHDDDVFEKADVGTTDQFGVDSPDLPERFAATSPQESKSDDENSPGLLRPVNDAGYNSYINHLNKDGGKRAVGKKHQDPVPNKSPKKSPAKSPVQNIAVVVAPAEVTESPDTSPQQFDDFPPDLNFEFQESAKPTTNQSNHSAAALRHNTGKNVDALSHIELADADKRRVVRSMCDLSRQPISVVMHALIVYSGDVDRAFKYLQHNVHEELHPKAWSVDEDAILQSLDEDDDLRGKMAALVERRGQAQLVERIAWLEALENQE